MCQEVAEISRMEPGAERQVLTDSRPHLAMMGRGSDVKANVANRPMCSDGGGPLTVVDARSRESAHLEASQAAAGVRSLRNAHALSDGTHRYRVEALQGCKLEVCRCLLQRKPRVVQAFGERSGSAICTPTCFGLKRVEYVDGVRTTLVWDGTDYLQGRS